LNPVARLETKRTWSRHRVPLLLAATGAFLASFPLLSRASSKRAFGVVLYQGWFSAAYFGIAVLGAACGAGLVVAEVSARTWDALLLSELSPREIVRGKLAAGTVRIALYLLAATPLGAAAWLAGAVSPAEVLLADALLVLVAAQAVAYGLAVGVRAQRRGAAALAVSGAAIVAPASYLTLGLGTSFVANVKWSDVPGGLPVWLPTALVVAPFDGAYLGWLVWAPLALIGICIWFFYELAVARVQAPGEDGSSGLRRWYFVALLVVTSSAAALVFDMVEARSLDGLLGGLLSIAVFVFFSILLFAGEPLGAEQRREPHASVDDALERGLFRTFLLVVVSGIAALSAVGLLAFALLYGDGVLPSGRAVGVLVCGEYWGAFLVFTVGLVSWVRTRSQSVVTARIVPALVCLAVSAGPWIAMLVARLTDRRLDDALPLMAPSPLYALDVARALELGSPRLALPASIACSMGWIAAGLSLLGLARRRADRSSKTSPAAPPGARDALTAPG
jgi:hypothetical protein